MPSGKTGNTLKFVILVAALAALWYAGRFFRLDAVQVQGYLKRLPLFYSGPVFVLLYVVVTFFVWFSKDLFRLAAALLFGAYISTLFVFIAECTNAAVLFYFSRYLGRGFVRDNLDKKLKGVNFLWLFLFRATPLIPFRFLDLACGMTRISFKRYFTAVALGSPLRIFWVQYVLAGIGRAVFNPQALCGYLLKNKAVLFLSFIYLVLIVIVAVKIQRKEESK